MIVLPLLGWLLGVRLRNRMTSTTQSPSPMNMGIGAVCALLHGAALAVSFEAGVSALTSSLFFGLFVLSAMLPIYRIEYIFGFVVGMTFTFGGVLPVLVALVVAAVSALMHFAFRAVISAIRSSARPSGEA